MILDQASPSSPPAERVSARPPRLPRAAYGGLTAIAAVVLAAPVLLVGGAARASFPASVRARPVSVEIGGTPDSQSVTVRGVLSLAYDGITGGGYVAPVCGSIRWHCRSAPSEQDLCRMTWADLQAAARDGACVAFGALMWQGPANAVEPYDMTVRENPQDAHPYSPTAAMGVVRIPCHPVPADIDRPDLSLACPTVVKVDPPVVEPPSADAGRGDDGAAVGSDNGGGASGAAGGDNGGGGGATGGDNGRAAAGGDNGRGGGGATSGDNGRAAAGGAGGGGSTVSGGGTSGGGGAGPPMLKLAEGGGCSLARGRASLPLGSSLVALALALARRRRKGE
jgi:hypothetical protein